MPGLAKKRPNDRTVILNLKGPLQNRDRAIKAIASLGFHVSEDSAPMEEVFPDFNPGEALAGARYRECLTQRQLAELTGIPQRHISEMENGKRTIGKEVAKRVAKALNADYRAFL